MSSMTPLKLTHVEQIKACHLAPNKLCVVVFGPGEGEGILLRFPDASLAVVDGCRAPRNKKSGRGDPIRELISDIDASGGESEAVRIRFVALTHPHLDHCRGMAELLTHYTDRIDSMIRVGFGGNVGAKYWLKYFEILERDHDDKLLADDEKWGPKSLEKLFDAITKIEKHENCRPRTLGEGGGRLWAMPENGDLPGLKVSGVAPTDREVKQSERELHKALLVTHKEGQSPQAVSDPNETSGAILIKWGSSQVLLAGDYLTSTDPLCGWKSAREDIQGEVQVVNCAHHASVEAHHGELWESMKPKLTIVTPFKNASTNNPPRPEGIKTLLESGSEVLITSPPAWLDSSADELPRPERGWANPPLEKPVVNDPAFGLAVGKPISVTSFKRRKNAVAVIMDSQGNIEEVFVAGQADRYEMPSEVSA